MAKRNASAPVERMRAMRVGEVIYFGGQYGAGGTWMVKKTARNRWRLFDSSGAAVMSGSPAAVASRMARQNPKAKGLAARPLKRGQWYRGAVRITKGGEIQFRKG